jgi:hypothetical protein
MKSIIFACASLFALSAASAATMPSDVAIANAKAKLASVLTDPDPRFPYPAVKMATNGSTNYYCGMVAARNRMGGYEVKPFIVIGLGERAFSAEIIEDNPDTLGYERKMGVIMGYCNSDPNAVLVKF